MTGLIVNADDFGYTTGINKAVTELYAARALTSTTLMAGGGAVEDALQRLSLPRPEHSGAHPALGVGCHIVLVDGTPLSPPEEIRSLLADSPQAAAAAPRFRSSLAAFVTDLVRGRILEAHIEQEAMAQIRSIQRRGLRLTHLDTHKHTHLFPRVLRPLLRAALQCGIRAVRNPFEPAWSVQATVRAAAHTPLLRRAQVRALSRLQPAFLRLVAEAGVATTAGTLGVLATGTLDAVTLQALLVAAQAASAPGAVWELVCHPGYHDQALEAQPTRLQATREVERQALAAAGRDGLELLHFGDLARPGL
ncbi:MAG TPA: ChbG/HpnK family deacetylase [Acidobacteriaceae bacterium]